MPIPARPYLGVSPENEADILAVVEDYLDQVLHA
jgi:phage gpG-like protein